jgi:hypothetical protein
MSLNGIRLGGQRWSRDVFSVDGIFTRIQGWERGRRPVFERCVGKPVSNWPRVTGANGIPVIFEAGTGMSSNGVRGRKKRPCGAKKT